MARSTLKALHQPRPHLSVYHTAHAIRRYDSSHPRQAGPEPVPLDNLPAIPPADAALFTDHVWRKRCRHGPTARPIVEIKTEQMQRRTQELHGGGGGELRRAEAAADPGRKERRGVEGGEDGERVTACKKCEAGARDDRRGPRRSRRGSGGDDSTGGRGAGAKEACKPRVLVQAE